MNELGILIDITHASAQAQAQIVEASTAPVVASHVAMEAVSGGPSGVGMLSDNLLKAVANRGTWTHHHERQREQDPR
jgi:membrane dipeptidase